MDNRDDIMKKVRANRFASNNGTVMNALNILRIKYEKLSEIQPALDIPEDQFLDSINFLELAGYIIIRDYRTRKPTSIADTDMAYLEAKISEKGIRLFDDTNKAGGKSPDEKIDL